MAGERIAREVDRWHDVVRGNKGRLSHGMARMEHGFQDLPNFQLLNHGWTRIHTDEEKE